MRKETEPLTFIILLQKKGFQSFIYRCHRRISGKWSPKKWSPENWSPESWSAEKWSRKTQNGGVSVKHCGVCMEFSNMINLWKPKTRQQTRNSETKNPGVSDEHRGVCEMFGCDQSMKMFGCDQSPLVFYSFVHVGSWSERQTYFFVCSGINRWKLKSRLNFLASFWRRTIFEGYFSGDHFSRDHCSGDQFSGDHSSGDHFSGDHFSGTIFPRAAIDIYTFL